jgi:type IV pilus assembly protein PilC
MRFNYQARTKDGQLQTGVVEASSREAAVALLQKHDLFVTLLENVETIPFWMRSIRIGGISSKDIVAFSRQLAVMFKSNVPLLEALQTIAEGFSAKPNFREKILKIAEEIEGGSPLSQALSLYPNIFSPFYISMVKSGETSGKLSGDLVYLADHLERDHNFRSKVTGAMIYPAFVLAVAVIVLILMTTMVIPQLTEFLISAGQELPWVTKAIISFSDFMRKWILVIIVAFTVIIGGFLRYKQTEEGKKIFDRISLKIPLLGDLSKKIYLTRIAENLATLISGGLPIAQALEISADVVGNTVYKRILLRTREEVRRGETISTVMKDYPDEISPLFIQMTVVGEKTGQIDQALMNVVDFYQKETERDLDSLISLLEPALIIFLAVIVAFIMLAILMPIYQTVSGF